MFHIWRLPLLGGLLAVTCEEATPASILNSRVARTSAADVDSKEHVQMLVKGAVEAFASIKAMVGQLSWEEVSVDSKDMIDAQLRAITDVIMTAIVNDKQLSQRQIGQSVADLATKTDTVVKLKSTADAKDAKVNNCREAERDVLNGTMGDMEAVVVLRDEKLAKCQARDTAQWLEWDAPPIGTCDFEKDEFCDTFAEVQEYLRLFKEHIPNDYTDYHDKKVDCEAAVEALDAKLGEGTVSQITDGSFMAKKADCDGLHGDAVTAMCSFGDRLQEKCATKTRYDVLVNGEANGGPGVLTLSEIERQKQFLTVVEIKCWLENFKNGKVDDAALDSCKSKSDYVRDVGIVDVRSQDVEPLMTNETFNCQETQVGFSGTRWQTGSHPSDYVEEPFIPNVFLSPLGSYPFSFCDPVDPVVVQGPLP